MTTMSTMNTMRTLGVLLVLAGFVGFAFGGSRSATESREAQLSRSHGFDDNGRERVDISEWLSAGAIAGGLLMLMFERRAA